MPARHETGGRVALLTAAARLFGREGLRAVSMERVAAEAGLTKRAAYYHFPEKEALIDAYLADAGPNSLAVLKRLAAGAEPGRATLLALFDNLGQLLGHDAFHGCVMLRASVEMEAGREASRRHKAEVEAWFASQLAVEGLATAKAGALLLVLDGALSDAVLFDPAEVAARARRVASLVINAD